MDTQCCLLSPQAETVPRIVRFIEFPRLFHFPPWVGYFDRYSISAPSTVPGTVLVPIKCEDVSTGIWELKGDFKSYLIQSDSLKESFFKGPSEERRQLINHFHKAAHSIIEKILFLENSSFI